MIWFDLAALFILISHHYSHVYNYIFSYQYYHIIIPNTQVVICPSESDVHELEIEAVSTEIVKSNKITELANALEMTIHLPLPPNDIIKRWQKEMNLMNLPSRHYLIHHLICIGLPEMAHK